MNRLSRSAAFAALLFTGCASLSPAAQRLKLVTKPEVSNCKFLSVVYGGKRTGELFPKKVALEDAANRGATHVVVLYDQGGKYTADAFDCNQPRQAVAEKKPEPAPTPAPVEAEPAPAAVAAPPPAAPTPASAGPRGDWIVAVMGVASRAKVNDTLLENVGSQLRITIATFGVRTVDPSAQAKEIKALKQESYKGCYDDKCQIELGKALAASHILRTNVTKFGRVCVLNGELIDLKSEVAIGAASSQGDCTEEGFLTMIDEVAERLVAG